MTQWKSEGRMLKLPECFKYDAEFSPMQRNMKGTSGFIDSFQVKALSECLQSCLIKENCYSANYHQNNTICDLLSWEHPSMEEADGWRNYQTENSNKVDIHVLSLYFKFSVQGS